MRRFAARAFVYTRCAGFAAVIALQAALGAAAVHAQNRSETARVVWPFETSSLDPAGPGVQRSTWGVSWHIYDRLVSFALDEPRGKIQQYRLDQPKGDIAERWDVSEDGRTYTFHIRRGAVFHDGSRVTAEDVRWSLQRAISLPTTRFVLNLGGLTSEDQIKAVDEATLTIALPKPNRYLPLSLSTPFAPIINARRVKPHVTASDPWGGDWLKGNDAGSGAYRVATFRPDQVVLERNETWHGSPRPAMRWAVFQTVPEDTMRVALVERGLADIAIGLTPNAIDGVERRGQAQLLLVPMPNQFEFLVMNVQPKPFNDARVRQALAHAIPQEEIFRSVFLGRGTRLFGGVEEAQGATFPQPQSFAYDPKRIRDLLAEAGYPNGLDTTLSLCTCKAEYFENLAVALKDYLARVGIRVTIEKLPGARFGELQAAKQMPLYLENQVAWLNLPDYWIRIFYRGNTRSNFSGYANPALDFLLAKADDATSDADYDAAMRKMIAKQFRLPNIGFSVQKSAVERGIAKAFPLIVSSGRLVEYEGGGEETRSNRWLAELQQDMFIEISPADAAERGIKDGGWVWVTGAENSAKAKMKALVTERVGKGVTWMPFHFGGWFAGEDLRSRYPQGSDPIVLGESANTIMTYGYDPATGMQEPKVSLCQITAA